MAILAAGSSTFLRAAVDSAKVENKNIRLEFDRAMHSRVTARFDGKEIVLGPFTASETVTIDGAELADFVLSGSKQENVRDAIGADLHWWLNPRFAHRRGSLCDPDPDTPGAAKEQHSPR
jgi:hypothetical protein